ncbi:MAG: hypothetical protein JO100_08005 [Pseudonocardia sp.]|nr:hypothetical protein [Pseudonocardia sp.]
MAALMPPTQAATPGGGAWSGTTLLALLRAETRKTLSTRTWWALLIPAAVLSLLVNLAVSEGGGLTVTPALGMSYALGWFSAKLAVTYGVICASGEFRHQTITTSYLTAPGRMQLVVAKMLVAGAVGVAYAVASALLGLIGTLLGGGVAEGQFGPLLTVCAAAALTFALWAMLGVGVGVLVCNQMAAVVGVLFYLWPAEQAIAGVASLSGLGDIDEYLPGEAATRTLTAIAGENALDVRPFSTGALPWSLTLLIFAGYTAVVVLAGATVAQHRDIT